MIPEIFLRDSLFWSCVWQSTIFLVAGLAGSFILRHRSSRAHQVLFLAMIAAVIVPIMSILVRHYELGVFVADPVILQPPAEEPTTLSDYTNTTFIPTEDIEYKPGPIEENPPPVVSASESIKLPWRSILLYGWLAASSILAARLLITFVLGVCLLRRALPLNCQRIEEALHLAGAKLGIDKDVKVYSSNGIRSPVIWCWKRNPILLVPNPAGRLNNKIDWVGVLCHELAHWKRRDHICGLLSELVVCILPWHPLLWWAKSRLIRLSEQACDDWVLATGQPCTDYAESLLDLTPQGQMAFVPAVVRSKRGLAGRVQRILQDKCGNPRTGLIWALTAGIVAICITVGVAFAQTRPAKTEGTKDKTYYEGSFQLGKDINVELDAEPESMRKIVRARSIRFDKAGSDIKVTLRADVRKGLHFEWRTRIELLGDGGIILDQRDTLNNSRSLVSGQPVVEELVIEFSPFKQDEVANVRRFRIRFEQAGPVLDELGRPYDADRTDWIRGRVTGPDGQPAVDAIVLINEHKPEGGPFRVPRIGTDEKGYYRFGAVDWPYRIGAEHKQPVPSTNVDCYQIISLKRILNGPQEIDFRFQEPPKGTSSLVGRLVDTKEVPIREFTANVSIADGLSELFSEDANDADEDFVKSIWFNQEVNNEDGVFRLDNIPAGKYRIRIIPKEKKYEWHRQEIVLADNKTTNLVLEVHSKHVLYGRVLFEDGSPAVIKPEPWPGARTRILVPLGGRARGLAAVEEDGYFTAYLNETELERLKSTGSSLIINVPTTQQGRSKTVGRFPFELLSTEKSKAGAVKVSRPETKTQPVSDEASLEVDLRGNKQGKISPVISLTESEEQNDAESDVIVLRLVDSSGKPVAGAKVGTNVRTRDTSVLGSKLSWSLRSREHNFSNDWGEITLTREKLFSPSWPADRKLALYVLHEKRHIGAVCEISRDGKREEINLTLEPVCRVHGRLGSKALKKIGQPLTWTNVYLGWNRDSFGVLSHMSDNQRFDFLVPPGRYELNVYGSRTKSVRPKIEVKTNQSELNLGVIDLPPTKITSLIGKPAIEFGPIKAWKNGPPIKLADLIGKAVIIYFDGNFPNTSRDLPLLVNLHEQFHDKGLVIIALYNCASMEELKKKWIEVYERFGGVSKVPFRVAIDGGEPTFYEGTNKKRLGATYGAYDITRDPTTMLIDTEGKVVGSLNIRQAKEILEQMLRVKLISPALPAWRQRFDEVYRLNPQQVIKLISPPFIPERRDYYLNEDSQQASFINRSPDRFTFHWDGKLKRWGGRFGSPDLNSALIHVFRLKSYEYELPEELLSLEIPGDWIIRDEAPQETKLKALEQLLADELGRYIRFQKRTVEREVIVATGQFQFRPLPEALNENLVYMFSDIFDDRGGGGGTAESVPEFLFAIGNQVGMPVLNKTQPSEEMMIPYHHHSSSYLRRVKDETEKAEKLRMMLDNLTSQTELQFEISLQPVQVWFVTERKNNK